MDRAIGASPERKNPFDKASNLHPRVAQAALVWGAGQTAWNWGKALHTRLRARSQYTVKVPGTDEVFGDLHEWLLEHLPLEGQRALLATTGERRLVGQLVMSYPGESRAYDAPANVEPPPRVRLRYDGTQRQTVTIEGHRVDVEVERDDSKFFDRLPDNWQAEMQRMVFRAQSREGRDAVLRLVGRLVEARQDKPGPPPLRMASRWGTSWVYRRDLPPRTLDSVVLRAEQAERLVADLTHFLAAEADYVRRSVPWHRGYLFHGPPGSGKTSMAKALAHHFDLPLYYLPMGQMKEDAELINLVSEVEPRSLLLLEDVDVFHSMTDRDDESKGPSLSAVLNSLDGVWTPWGMVTILTTNDREALDAAVLRPGRVDVEEEFDMLDRDQARRVAQWYTGGPVPDIEATAVGRSPAWLIEELHRREAAADVASEGGLAG